MIHISHAFFKWRVLNQPPSQLLICSLFRREMAIFCWSARYSVGKIPMFLLMNAYHDSHPPVKLSETTRWLKFEPTKEPFANKKEVSLRFDFFLRQKPTALVVC